MIKFSCTHLEFEMPVGHLESFWKSSFTFRRKSELRIGAVFTWESHQCHNPKESFLLVRSKHCGIKWTLLRHGVLPRITICTTT